MQRTKAILGTAVLAVAALWGPVRADAAIPFFDELAPTSAAYSGPSTVQPLVGDFTGDGRTDVFLYVPGSGAEVLKEGQAGRTFLTITASIGVTGTYTPLVGDFDGNGIDDIFWYGVGSVPDSIWLFTAGGKHTIVKTGVSGTYEPFVGDWAADGASNGKTDIFWYSPSGTDSMWRATGSGAFTSIPQRIGAGLKPLVGAFTPNTIPGDGSTDGTLDIFWYGPGSTRDYLWRGDGTGHFASRTYTVNGTYQPVVGYFDGYGVNDIFWYSPTGGDSVWLADPDLHIFQTYPASIGAGFQPIQGEFTLPDTPILWWSPTGVDDMWFPQGEPGTWDYFSFYDNTNMGSGYLPVTGDFDGDHFRDIYWIKPGAGAERVFYGRTDIPPG